MKLQYVILISLVVVLVSATMNQAISSNGVTPIDVNDPHAIDIAKFAVNEYNKESKTTKLSFEKILNGVPKTTSTGTIYRFTLSASDGSTSNEYGAIVLENQQHSLKLIHFAPIHA
ncbi:putative cysteine proteinase inhibitor 7 [Lathyrus oleraceus]|uniref:putative cysteine proteinase inhibitor 7 n=1 Tax=Pisum sativum TaxID=3888 RepID=UPI001FC585BB|nr:putative cysteine proteinase inhibitor 7 [Pisum sativum]